MTALDQAFIKAYKNQGSAERPAPAAAKPAGPRPDIGVDQLGAKPASKVTKLNDVMAALQKPSGRITDAHSEAAPGPNPQTAGGGAEILSFPSQSEVRPSKSRAGQKRKKKAPPPTLDELDVPDAIYRVDPPSPTVPDAPRSAAFAAAPPREQREQQVRPNGAALAPAYADQPAPAPSTGQNAEANAPLAEAQKNRRFDAPQSDAIAAGAGASPSKGYPDSAIRVFQPMLQVDHFAWPRVCQRLESAASTELARLAETLLAATNQGMKVMALGAGQRGEGATTLLLCTARQLAARNLKVVLVDADLGEPQLAKRLGLLAQLGWEDVATGRQPVEEVLIESSTDKLAVLPLCGPLEISGISYASQRIMAESLEVLRKNFDLVLLDLGPLDHPQSLSALTSAGLNCRIDAMTIVHRTGKVLATCIPAVRQSLATAGISVIGVIENFVPEAPEAEFESQYGAEPQTMRPVFAQAPHDRQT
jgi:Mrp family chromosome partitioning ATPase